MNSASSSNATGAISIPSTLGGCPVASIGRNEFRSGFGWRVFEESCNNMTSVSIPSGVVNIGNSAFLGCSNLVSVTIPASVTNIARCAFSSCGSLTSFTVDDKNPKHSSRNGLLCSKDGSTLISGVNGDVTIPLCVKNIGDNSFSGCTGLTSVTIPSSVTNIGYEAFNKCQALTLVAIPSSVKSIGSRAFVECPNLKMVHVVREGNVETISFDDFFKHWKEEERKKEREQRQAEREERRKELQRLQAELKAQRAEAENAADRAILLPKRQSRRAPPRFGANPRAK